MRFYVRRTARIFPVYYVLLAVVTVAGLWGLVEVGSPARQLSNWFYLSNIYIGLNGWETRLGHLWSLAVEEQFYLLFAPLALACPLRQLHVACFSILGASLLGQNHHSDAEPLLLAGYEGMHQREARIPEPNRSRLTSALERLVQLYDATQQPEKASVWREKLEARRAAEKNAKKSGEK